MNLRKASRCLGLGLLLFVSACGQFAPPPTGVVLLPTSTLTPTARPTYLPAVRDTATALAIAARLGGTPTLAASEAPATNVPASEAPASQTPAGPTDTATLELIPSPTPLTATPAPSRTPIGNPTGQSLPVGCSALHTVEPGEWLTEIAQLYGVDVDALARANHLTDASELTPGQVLCIPGANVAATTPTRPSPSASRTAAPASGLAILTFTADPNPVDRGAVVRLAWTVRNTTGVTVWPLTYDYHLNQWFRQTTPTYSGTGDAELTVAVPMDIRGPLRYELEARDSAGAKVTAQTDLIQPFCSPAFYGGPTDPSFCLLPAETAPAEYQRFERGFMIWRSDTGDVFVLTQDTGRSTFWLLTSPAGAAVQTGTPPSGEYAPGGHFAETWATLGPAEFGGSLALRDLLGWATSEPQQYNLTEQMRLDARYADFDTLYVGWPDGQVAQLFTGGGIPHAGTIGPAWFLFTPTP